jgi:2-keto-4-pentenoate hydratase
MKVILIAWFVVSGDTSGTSVTAEFDSMEACESAALALELAGSKGKGKNVNWRYVCTPK